MVLLVDDDSATNFLHRRAIRRSGSALEIMEANNGADALAKLRAAHDKGEDPPQYIFLDINMPVLDGWGFLDEYQSLPKEWRQRCKLFMLTTSLNPDDHERAHSYAEVNGVVDKMLDAEKFGQILETDASASATSRSA